VCEPTWVGVDCGVLNLLPAPTNTGFNLNLSSSWGGGVLYDNTQGIYHMYMALMENHCGLDTWTQNSAIAHAIGKTPLGPFLYQDTIIPAFAHNPQPFQAPDGTYLIFHIGCGDNPPSSLQNCTNGTTPNGMPEKVRSKRDATPCWAVRVLSATSLDGPWTDNYLFSPPSGQEWPKSTDNPSAYFFPNGSVMIMFRSWFMLNATTPQSWIGVATANNWTGPYHVPSAPIFTVNQEDPYLWRNKNGYFHALYHTQVAGPAGRHAYSLDGVNWTLSATPAYNTTIQFEDGTSWTYQRRERPQLHFDPVSGLPSVLYNGVQPNAYDRTYTMATPIFTG